ncbi:hypothetical protein TNCV_2809561 [Trichonephila clavipes]|nr:hypothetical protein TNCV_2809561 [Trichonephila clavipes]
MRTWRNLGGRAKFGLFLATMLARPRIWCSRKKQFFPKLNASSETMAQTSKGSYLDKLPLCPTDPLYHCRDFRYGPEYKKTECHSLGSTE